MTDRSTNGLRRPRRTPQRIALLLLALALFCAPAAEARRVTWLQRLRELIGYNPRQAIGGSRSGGGEVCLITPRLQPANGGSAPTALVSLPGPVLLAGGPLNEIRIEQNGRILWSRRASSTQPITGPIPWPLPPLTPGSTMTLRLRPVGAAGADFAEIQLRAASAEQQQQASALLADPARRLQTIEGEASSGRYALASELLFSELSNPPKDLLRLRQDLIQAGCTAAAS